MWISRPGPSIEDHHHLAIKRQPRDLNTLNGFGQVFVYHINILHVWWTVLLKRVEILPGNFVALLRIELRAVCG